METENLLLLLGVNEKIEKLAETLGGGCKGNKEFPTKEIWEDAVC